MWCLNAEIGSQSGGRVLDEIHSLSAAMAGVMSTMTDESGKSCQKSGLTEAEGSQSCERERKVDVALGPSTAGSCCWRSLYSMEQDAVIVPVFARDGSLARSWNAFLYRSAASRGGRE